MSMPHALMQLVDLHEGDPVKLIVGQHKKYRRGHVLSVEGDAVEVQVDGKEVDEDDDDEEQEETDEAGAYVIVVARNRVIAAMDMHMTRYAPML
jgi:antitoxin component of MazEF toxin-antitoxin module